MRRLLPVLFALLTVILPHGAQGERLPRRLADALDPTDALLVTEAQGPVVFSQNPDTLCVPASTLKIATALLALNTLGPSHRFPTDVAVSPEGTLCLKGFGDPLLTSEVLDAYAAVVAEDLKGAGIRDIPAIGVDDSYFERITIPGVIPDSAQPYDAPNGALCANFNTVFFRRTPGGALVSGEPQTPLLPFVARRIPPEAPEGRIRLAPAESRLYAGHLFGWFLQKHGIRVGAAVAPHPFPSGALLYEKRLLSPWTLAEALTQLMTFSNNFMANQIFLACGAQTDGAPGTLAKSRKALCNELTRRLGRCPAVVEGSGISRQNKLSARTMDALLKQFAPHARLLHAEGQARYKTGTLDGVSTRAGYLTTRSGKRYRFVIFTGRNHGDAGVILDRLQTVLAPK